MRRLPDSAVPCPMYLTRHHTNASRARPSFTSRGPVCWNKNKMHGRKQRTVLACRAWNFWRDHVNGTWPQHIKTTHNRPTSISPNPQTDSPQWHLYPHQSTTNSLPSPYLKHPLSRSRDKGLAGRGLPAGQQTSKYPGVKPCCRKSPHWIKPGRFAHF